MTPTSRVAVVAARHSSAYSFVSPAAASTASWLWRGEKSMTWLEWPAWGGSTRVGTTSSSTSAGAVKSRRCANGVDSVIVLSRCQRGSRRSAIVLHHSAPRARFASGVRGRVTASSHRLPAERVSSTVVRAAAVAL
ncbi:hypothetical protein [Pseudonocardia broussonetiae]|uniref:hypothetical protein n=1 Tax=Pseudonocardia broussonetiae TaxID=2736640 RepID=UPI001F046065|nr:hypothetical protein [Pseudonocardia broussonetiae]